MDRNPPANAADTGLVPGLGRFYVAAQVKPKLATIEHVCLEPALCNRAATAMRRPWTTTEQPPLMVTRESQLQQRGPRWEGTRQEGQGSANGGKRLQGPDIFLSLKSQEETNQRYFFLLYTNLKEVSLEMLCCHDTWSHLKLTTLKPCINQYISFSYGNVVLNYDFSNWFCQIAQPTYSDCEWLYNNNVSCLRTVFGLNPLANSVILKHKLWE